MPTVFNEGSADQLWRQIATVLLGEAGTSHRDSRLGDTRELLHTMITLRNPRDRWVRSRVPGINPAFAIAEVFWILSGSNSAAEINFWNPALPRYAGHSEKYHGAYGFRLRNQFGFDQVESAYEALCENPMSRQVVLQIWDAKSDFPRAQGKPAAPDIPCNICSFLKLRNGKLEWFQVLRSNDICRGTPYNIVQFTMLQEIMAGWLGCDVGEYSQYCDSMHLYESDVKLFSVDPISEEISIFENLSLPKDESSIVIPEMIDNLSMLAHPALTEAKLSTILSENSLPAPYRNLLFISGADSARRRGWVDVMNEVADQCTNLSLVNAWTKWSRSRQ